MTRAAGVVLVVGATACHHANPSDGRIPAGAARAALGDPGAAFWQTRAPDAYAVRFETTRGAFTIAVHRAWAPRGADRFYQLVGAGFFDDSRLYRVLPGYIVQFGIAGDPATAQRWRDRRIDDDSVRQSNVRGTVGFAMTGPNTRTTQIYINLRDNSRLDAQGFSPIGVVTDGMDVVDRLNGEYGERSGGGMRAGHQDSLFVSGNAYLDRAFPRLDHLLRATIVRTR